MPGISVISKTDEALFSESNPPARVDDQCQSQPPQIPVQTRGNDQSKSVNQQ
ncbi:hypothetical protein PM8797T_05505 [Gimesia maris DSM 8797]|nr:hypothetical protein PM8797T_05505 [Gimesia maris DSM 8797]